MAHKTRIVRTDGMPWNVGVALGKYCGRTGCKRTPAAYSTQCGAHRERSYGADGGAHGGEYMCMDGDR